MVQSETEQKKKLFKAVRHNKSVEANHISDDMPNPDTKDWRGMTALEEAFRAGNVASMAALIENGANPDVKGSTGKSVRQMIEESGRADMLAVLGKTEPVQPAVEHSLKPEDKPTVLQETVVPLMTDAELALLDKPERVVYLQATFATRHSHLWNGIVEDSGGVDAALVKAVNRGKYHFAKTLLDKGVDVAQVKTSDGRPLLDAAFEAAAKKEKKNEVRKKIGRKEMSNAALSFAKACSMQILRQKTTIRERDVLALMKPYMEKYPQLQGVMQSWQRELTESTSMRGQLARSSTPIRKEVSIRVSSRTVLRRSVKTLS